MGEVWAAVGPAPDGIEREVAIKVLLARAAMKPDLVRRFEREATIASAITSPYVCQLIEVARAEDGAHLLVFEHLSGESLADRLKREQYLPFSEVGPIIEDVLQGLAAAHAAGVIHRDLKPGNIFLEQLPAPSEQAYAPPSGGFGFGSTPPDPPRRERAKILDFGISKLSRREKEEPTLTAFDATLGSFAYMAPEQVRGAARADERADIYAVGAVAFRALSGRLPFEGTTAALLVALKLERQAPSLAEATGEQWPAGVERFLERALERRREHRFANAAEALDAWRAIQPSAVVAMRPRPQPSQPPVEASAPVAIDHPGKPRQRPPSAPPAVTSREAPPPLRAQAPVSTRAKPQIPAPTKPVVSVRHPVPVEPMVREPFPSEPIFVRQPMQRHGTLTQDELPDLTGTPLPGTPITGRTPITAPRPAAVPSMPAINVPRPPMQSYQIIEDNPTEVDGPPEMTFDGNYQPVPAPPTDGPGSPDAKPQKRNKTGRP
jgi:serine/threonine-protein kinase